MKQSNLSQKSEQMNKDKILENHFNEVKLEDYSESFPAVENWIYKTNIQLKNKQNENKQNERKLQKMKNFLFANKLRLAYSIVTLAVIIATCNMPVTQTETAGQVITLTVPTNNTDFAAKMSALPWIKNAQVSSNGNTEEGLNQTLYTIILPDATQEQAVNYGKELESLGGITTIKITPLDYDVKRPLYSAALDHFFSIKIDATGMSDQEVEQLVQKHLKK
ncbi:MAG: hypothetical protein L0Y79_09740, partial [Chlorobi bacterium]|nr:hypothetical protein [Chlorobiota bacterium]